MCCAILAWMRWTSPVWPWAPEGRQRGRQPEGCHAPGVSALDLNLGAPYHLSERSVGRSRGRADRN